MDDVSVDVTALGLKPRRNLPLGLPGLVGPRACPGQFSCVGAPLCLLRGPPARFACSAGAALRECPPQKAKAKASQWVLLFT
ncbi:unnamed protein product [Prunus armeniaca]